VAEADVLRQTIAAALILSILGVVLYFGVSGLLHILLVFTAGLLSVILVRRPRVTSAGQQSEE
jgi:zinc transporter ZupT